MSDEQQEATDFVKNEARKFTIMNSLWLRKGSKTFSESTDPEYTAANRLENYHHKIQGDLAELRSALPLQLRSNDYWESQWFAKLVSHKCTSQHAHH